MGAPTTGKLVATGNDILFWEFGTGVTLAPGSHPKAAEFGVEPASFSAKHAGWLVGEKLEKFKGKWPYKNTWTYGQPPRKAMWGAAKYMREHIGEAAAGVKVFTKRRGRPTNWGSGTSGGISIKGLADISNHIAQLEDFVSYPDNTERRAFVASLLRVGESYAAALIDAGEDVSITSEVEA